MSTSRARYQREPGLKDGSEGRDVRLYVLALAVRVRLVLQDGGLDGRNLHHAVHIGLVEVGQADGVNLPGLDAAFHRLIGVLVVGSAVVQQKKVDVIQSQPLFSFTVFVSKLNGWVMSVVSFSVFSSSWEDVSFSASSVSGTVAEDMQLPARRPIRASVRGIVFMVQCFSAAKVRLLNPYFVTDSSLMLDDFSYSAGDSEKSIKQTEKRIAVCPALKDKTLIPFGTHGGSGVGSYKAMLQKYYPSAKYLESLGISGASVRDAASKTSVERWVKKLGLFGHSER